MGKKESKFIQGVLSANSLHNPQKYVGKIRDNITYRSSWELSLIKFLDNDDSILEWSSEEKVIIYTNPIDKKKHRYFLDFYIKYKNYKGGITEALVEIKPFHETQKPVLTEGMSEKSKNYAVVTYLINTAKWNAAREYCKSRNMTFLILTEKEICMFKEKK